MKTLSIGNLLCATAAAVTFACSAHVQAQPGYAMPALYGQTGGMPPGMPASPLAGGMPAAQGSAFIDAHGNRVVMPANYAQGGYACEDPYGGGYGACQMGGAGAGYGDVGTGYADFGGYGVDQCGPHYFDVAVDAVVLSESELFAASQPFGSVGAGADAPRILDASASAGDMEAGWQIAGRYDIGPLSVLEGTYMGLYNMGFSDSVRSVDVTTNPPGQDYQLFSAFSNYGVPSPLPGIDDGSVYALGYESTLESVEFSYRRYWVGALPRISGTWLMGFRYLKLDENLSFRTESLVNVSAVANSAVSWDTNNDLLGFQLGGDGWIALRQGLRLGTEAKAGIYNNRFTQRNLGAFPSGVSGAPSDFDVTTKDDQVAFAGELNVNLVADILPSISLRGGYRLLYLNSLATAGGAVDLTNIESTVVASQGDALFQGFTCGMEYIW